MKHPTDIVCLVPASRPEMAERVLANFRRQNYDNKFLLVVENGAAVGAYEEQHGVNVICCDDAHHSAAKNAGIEYLRKAAPDAYCCIMDDDDIYGPEYLADHAAHAERGVIAGKAPGWVMTDEGLMFFRRRPGDEAVCGGSMGFFVEDAQEFPRKLAEEHEFISEAKRSGCRLNLLGPEHFCYERRNGMTGHAYKYPSQLLWRLFGCYGLLVDAEPLDVIDDAPQGPIQRGIDRRVRVAA